MTQKAQDLQLQRAIDLQISSLPASEGEGEVERLRRENAELRFQLYGPRRLVLSDHDLMRGLQMLFDKGICLLSSRRSGMAAHIYTDDRDYHAWPETKEWKDDWENGPSRTYWGGTPPEDYGCDVRAAIQRAIDGESALGNINHPSKDPGGLKPVWSHNERKPDGTT